MPAEQSQRIPSAAIRRCIDLLTAEVCDKLVATEFLRLFREHGFFVGRSCQAMVERMLDRKGESLEYDDQIAAADNFVACCGGSTDDAFGVLEAYTELLGDQTRSSACAHGSERTQDARIVPG